MRKRVNMHRLGRDMSHRLAMLRYEVKREWMPLGCAEDSTQRAEPESTAAIRSYFKVEILLASAP